MLPLILILAVGQPPATHEARNSLYKELLEPGLTVGTGIRTKLPPPTMSDGLDAAGQKAVIMKLIENDYSWDNFTRKSIVTPQILKLRDAMPTDPKAPARGVDIWFIAYGDLAATEDEKFLERLLNVGRGDGKSKSLTAEELAKRKITLSPEAAKYEGYGQVEFDFLNKVRLKVTGHSMWSRTPESVVAAAMVDPRFLSDPEFPNDWRSLDKRASGLKVGPPNPYAGAGFYLKITRLAEPAGSLFVEQHVVFTEPAGWFNGANLLRSKLPPLVQNNVRNMRREWQKGK